MYITYVIHLLYLFYLNSYSYYMHICTHTIRISYIKCIGMLNFLVNILTMISNKSLCGQDNYSTITTAATASTAMLTPIPPKAETLSLYTSTTTTAPTPITSADTTQLLPSTTTDNTLNQTPSLPPPVIILQSIEEQQLLLFIIDLVSCLRRSALKFTMYGKELNALRISLTIVLSCLGICNDNCAEKLTNEVSF